MQDSKIILKDTTKVALSRRVACKFGRAIFEYCSFRSSFPQYNKTPIILSVLYKTSRDCHILLISARAILIICVFTSVLRMLF